MAGKKHSRALHLAYQEASRGTLGVRLDIDPIDALQEVLDRAVTIMRHAGERADALTEDEMTVMTAFGPVANEWIRLEADMRKEVHTMAHNMVRADIADRAVRVQEAQAAMFFRAVVNAARSLGLPPDTLKRLGPALRAELEAQQAGPQTIDVKGRAA